MDPARFLTDIIAISSGSPDLRSTIENLARLGAIELADWCGVYSFENDQTVRRLTASPAPQGEALFPLHVHAPTGPGHVRRTGQPQLLTNPGPEIAESLGLEPGELILPRGRRAVLYACMPAIARNRTMGAVVFICTDPQKPFGDIELSLAASLASAAALAMDNSRLHRDAQEANRLKDEFVATVSHELRTPLTPILGCVHLLRSATLGPSSLERVLEIIERNAQTQLHIVEDLLDASKIVAGKLHLTMKSTEVVPVVEAAITTVRSSAESKGIEIVTEFDESRLLINGDPHRLQQIVWNLLSNAVKFTPPNGRILVSVRSEANHVRIEVGDTGIGISPDLLPYIFNGFTPATNGNTKTRSGLGLGLAIVRHLVDLHNGVIHAVSAGPDQGAVFTLQFPAAAHRAATANYTSDK